MAAAWYTFAGRPDDSVGAVGDFAYDYQNFFVFGPKATATSWAGAVVSRSGSAGQGLASGVGAPAATYGAANQGYFDAATANSYRKNASGAWGQVGALKGAQGPTGPDALTSLAPAYGPFPHATAIALGTTPVAIPLQNSSIAATFAPAYASAFLGAFIQNNSSVSVTFTLQDQTTNQPVYTTSLGTNGLTSQSALFDPTTYPLIANHSYVWLASAAAGTTGYVVVWPVYLFPASNTGKQISTMPLLGFSGSNSFSSTVQSVPPFGSNFTPYWVPLRQGGFHNIQAQLIATGGAASTNTVTLTLYNSPVGGSASNVQLQYTLTSDGVNRTLYGPICTDTTSLSVNTRYFWQVKSGTTFTGTLVLAMTGYV